MSRVVIGMDPHKRSATIEVLNEQERVLHTGQYPTDRDGYRQMLAIGRQFGHRLWAVEGSRGVGRYLTQRLVADDEAVVDVPAKLAARARVFDTGNGRKTDAADAQRPLTTTARGPPYQHDEEIQGAHLTQEGSHESAIRTTRRRRGAVMT